MKETETENFRELAFKYFNGCIDRADEKRLFVFLEEDDRQMQQFRQWEQEWQTEMSPDPITEAGWTRLKYKMALMAESPEKKTRHLHKKIMWGAVAAIAFILVFLSTFQWTESQVDSYFVFEAPKGEHCKLMLNDGTVVWLNSASTLRYSNTFGDKTRRVELQGEAYFEVAKLEGNEFLVQTEDCDIVVKGTKFNVVSYAEDNYVEATLMEGKIEFNHQSHRVSLSPGEQVRMSKESGEIVLKKVNAKQALSWMDGYMEYDRITLGELLPKLARYYDVDIRVETDSLLGKTLKFSVRNDETLDDVFHALECILPVKIVKNGREVLIK